MTNQLKDLMTQAVDAQAPYVPDVDTLLQTGRRQVRRRRVATAIATAAAVAVVAGATTIAVDTINHSQDPIAPVQTPARTPVLPLPSAPPGGSTGRCTAADGSPADGWLWPKVVLYAQDTFGMSMVRRSTTGDIAFCTTEVGQWSQTLRRTGRREERDRAPQDRCGRARCAARVERDDRVRHGAARDSPTRHRRDRRRACRRREGQGRVLRLPPGRALALAGAGPARDRPVQVRGPSGVRRG